jgi:hypothetical protein
MQMPMEIAKNVILNAKLVVVPVITVQDVVKDLTGLLYSLYVVVKITFSQLKELLTVKNVLLNVLPVIKLKHVLSV